MHPTRRDVSARDFGAADRPDASRRADPGVPPQSSRDQCRVPRRSGDRGLSCRGVVLLRLPRRRAHVRGFGMVAPVALPEGVRVCRSEERRGEALRTIFATAPSSSSSSRPCSRLRVLPGPDDLSAACARKRPGRVGLRPPDLAQRARDWLLELPLVAITQRHPYRPLLALGSLLVGLGLRSTRSRTTFRSLP
jgi:hypothetical protein